MVKPGHIPEWRARLYPFTPKIFSTPGSAMMSYLDEGPRASEAVLMLHGNPTWSFYYRNLVRELAPTMRCIVPDHIGMGLSEKPGKYDYKLATRITDVAALVASLGLQRVHLVVHDWGGAIGLGFAAKHPELIGRLVILNTAAFPAKRLPWRIALCRLPVLGPLLVRGCNGFAGPATSMAMHQRRLTADEKRGYLFPYGSWAKRIGVNAFIQDIPMAPSHPSWGTLEAVAKGLEQFRNRPVLIIWGGRDFCFDQYFLGRWKAIFPQAEQQVIAAAGHYVLEDAQETAVPLAAKFLRPAMYFPR
jgi:cis-3-alkyl-4-acyloxetan-2-one decarboxylase